MTWLIARDVKNGFSAVNCLCEVINANQRHVVHPLGIGKVMGSMFGSNSVIAKDI